MDRIDVLIIFNHQLAVHNLARTTANTEYDKANQQTSLGYASRSNSDSAVSVIFIDLI